MHALVEKLLTEAPVVTDGAWGTQLHARGLGPGQCPDAWNLTRPDQVEEVARAYVAAGSQIILTNTFGANRVRLAAYDLAEQAVEINRRGAELSKRAAGTSALVFASIGPCGKMLMMGDVTEDELREAFGEQARALRDGGADGIVIESMADLVETRLALEPAKDTGLPVVVSLVFDSGAEKDRTMMGVTPEQAAEELTAAGTDAVGANCGAGIAQYVPVCRRLHAATKLPVWIKANAGRPEVVEGRTVFRTTPPEFAGHVPALIEAGATFVGGCCGTTPEHIRAALKAVR